MSCNLEKFTVTASSTTGDHEQRDGSHPTTSCPRSNSTVHTASSQTNLLVLQTEEAAAVDRRDHEGKPQLTLSEKQTLIKKRCAQALVDKHQEWRRRKRLARPGSASASVPVTDVRQSLHTGSGSERLDTEDDSPSIYYLAPQDQADLTGDHSAQTTSSGENTLRRRSTSSDSLALEGSDDSNLDGSHDSEDEELVRLCERPWNKAQGTMTGR